MRWVNGIRQYLHRIVLRQKCLYQIIVENTIEVIILYDRNGKRLFVSRSAKEMGGYDPVEMLDKPAFDFTHPDDYQRVRATLQSIGPEKRSAKMTYRVQHKDGVYLWVESECRYLDDGRVLSLTRDITERMIIEHQLSAITRKLQEANDHLNVLAHQDGLTGLANRRCFDELLAVEFRRCIREQMPLSLLMIDIDSFKMYNDLYGHVAGDDCLRQISAAIQRNLQRPADSASRYGGEEIAVLLPGTYEDGALGIAERIRRAIADLKIEHFGSAQGFASVSIGVMTMMPQKSDQPTDLICAADRALYRAKAAGKNRVAAEITMLTMV